MDYDVPFIGNTPEDKQCLQAAYGMIRQYFEPGLEIDWEAWSKITGYVPGKGTWSMAGLMWFNENGYDVVHIGTFDYAQFALEGAPYLVEAFGEEMGNWRLQRMELEKEQARALKFVTTGVWHNRDAHIGDIKQYLQDGYLVKCLVNINILNGITGYRGHAVIVKGFTATDLILHDPGLPASPNRRVPFEAFEKAWIDPGTKTEKMDAVRKRPTEPVIDQFSGKRTSVVAPVPPVV